jgi:hypothetical protein
MRRAARDALTLHKGKQRPGTPVIMNGNILWSGRPRTLRTDVSRPGFALCAYGHGLPDLDSVIRTNGSLQANNACIQYNTSTDTSGGSTPLMDLLFVLVVLATFDPAITSDDLSIRESAIDPSTATDLPVGSAGWQRSIVPCDAAAAAPTCTHSVRVH